ncbi:hypothetical protein ACWF0M_05295 [Kribbella sp. NPDC055110]
MPDLRWSDLSQAGTPAIWDLADHAAVGSLVVRGLSSRTCPADGWLMVSAGSRADAGVGCGPVTSPRRTANGAKIPDLPGASVEETPAESAGPRWGRIGALGDAVHANGGCTSAVGPGAVLGLADGNGVVDYYAPDVRTSSAATWTRCPVTAVDVDAIVRSVHQPSQVPTTGEERRAAVREADQVVGSVLARVPAGSNIILAGLSDDGGPAHLHVALLDGGAGGGYLGSSSTRRHDLVLLPELAGTVDALIGSSGPVPGPDAEPGWVTDRRRPASFAAVVAELARHDVAAAATEAVRTFFVVGVAAVLVIVSAAAAAMILVRGSASRWGARARRLTCAAAAACAAIPVSTLLAGLLPWPGSSHPVLSMLAVTLLWAGIVAALAVGRRQRPDVLRPIIVLTGTTVVVVAADLVAGLSLQMDNPFGYTAVEGARYYGMGNVVFAVFATALLILAATVSSWGTSRGSWPRSAAVSFVVAAGLAGIAIDGVPGWGSDFGGVIALVCGVGVTALLVAERNVSVRRLVVLGVAGACVVLGMAFADHARGAAHETHLGRFAGQLVSGQATPVLGRKVDAMLPTLVFIPVVLAAIWLAVRLAGPERLAAAWKGVRSVPGLRSGLAGAVTVGLVGALVNDSGAIVAASVLLLAAPLTIAAVLGGPTSNEAEQRDAARAEGGVGQG